MAKRRIRKRKPKQAAWPVPELQPLNPLLTSLRLQVLEAKLWRLDASWHGTFYSSAYAMLYCVREGEGWIRHHGKEFTLRPGHMYIIPTDSPMDYACPRHVELYGLRFIATVFGGMEVFNYLPPDYEVEVKHPERLYTLCDHLRGITRYPSPATPFESSGILLQLLAPFLAGVDARRVPDHPEALERLWPVFNHIHTHLGEGIRVSELADMVHLSRSHLTRVFVNHFGVSPKQYIQAKRIDEAKRLLLMTNRTAESIARELGFTDAFHLSKTFSKMVGMSPAQFRRQEEPSSQQIPLLPE